MKNKKLFAILTLVAFMLTMMPVMAFATTSNQIGAWVEDDSAKVVIDLNDSDTITDEDYELAADTYKVVVGIDLPELLGNEALLVFPVVAGTNEVYTTDKVWIGETVADADTDFDGMFDYTDTEGMYTLVYMNDEAVELEFKAILVKDIDCAEDYSDASFTGMTANKAINKVGSGEQWTYANVAWDDDNAVAFTDGAKYPVVINIVDDLIDRGGETGADANNGVDYYVLTITVTKNNAPVKGADVNLALNMIGAELSADTVTTNARGVAKVNVFASKAGTYKVTATTAGAQEKESDGLVFANAAIGSITPVQPTGHFAVGKNFQVVVTGTDMNGNALVAADVEDAIDNDRVLEWVKVPADSAFDVNEAVGTEVDADTYAGRAVLNINVDAAGDYTLKMYDKVTGADVQYINFTAKDFLKTASVTLTYDATSYNTGATVPAPTVTFVDANGTKHTDTTGKTLKWSYTGVGVKTWNNDGTFVLEESDKFYGREITVNLVVDNCFAAATLKIAEEPAYLQFTEVTAPVGTEATVPVKSLDINGNVAAIGNVDSVGAPTAVVTSKPEGAVVSVVAGGLSTAASDDFKEKGVSAIKVASNKPGTVTVNVIVPYRPVGAGADKYLTGVATVNFGDEATPVNTSATLIINSTIFVANGGVQTAPAAPVIIDGRTYLPIRAVGQAIGANVDYVDGVITLTLGTQKATMVPGSNVMTVGTETVTMDAAPYLAGDGHTMVPVRYAAQAFGYDLGITTNADGSVATVTVFK